MHARVCVCVCVCVCGGVNACKPRVEKTDQSRYRQNQIKIDIQTSRHTNKYKIIDRSIDKENRGCPLGVMVKTMDCGIVVSEFELQSRYCVHFRTNTFGKGMNPLILPAIDQIVPLKIFSKDGFDIKLPIKVDMPLNNVEIETKLYIYVKSHNVFISSKFSRTEKVNIRWLNFIFTFYIHIFFQVYISQGI